MSSQVFDLPAIRYCIDLWNVWWFDRVFIQRPDERNLPRLISECALLPLKLTVTVWFRIHQSYALLLCFSLWGKHGSHVLGAFRAEDYLWRCDLLKLLGSLYLARTRRFRQTPRGLRVCAHACSTRHLCSSCHLKDVWIPRIVHRWNQGGKGWNCISPGQNGVRTYNMSMPSPVS